MVSSEINSTKVNKYPKSKPLNSFISQYTVNTCLNPEWPPTLAQMVLCVRQ